MQTATVEKRRTRYQKKANHEEKQKYKNKIISKADKKIELDKRKVEAPKKPRKVFEDVEIAFISAIDPYDAPLQWWETEHVRYAINYPPVKSRLEKVMGTHIVRLTDRKYMLLLMSKLLQDHMEQQETRIEKRKLPLPSNISRLLKISYKMLSEKIHDPRYLKLKLYV
ncbi:uncharacterized protein LOC100740265 [Bombus impatiens]|uniref:Uncharacterized protein LOC100740265 n=1 Tax=Bombus impatiens TaxID=132113 RepID=A0A6P3UV96_BOMIM|nr:uncharacterized protein LOC100740265 [Bombus impatiens]